MKWAGGKGRLIPQLALLLPRDVEQRRHVEPFFGGGALYFSRRPAEALLMDINGGLVRTYATVRDDVHGVVRALGKLARAHTEPHYYEARERYNRGRLQDVSHAAHFIYLNKTCFNGLHRVNKKGQFNVPFGKYKNPGILNPETLLAASHLLRGAELVHGPFEGLLGRARAGDFVYLDPPYAPVSATANFTSYTQEGFGPRDQEHLRDVFAELDRRGCKLMLSNSNAPLIHDLYKGYQFDQVAALRAINCNARNRGHVTEVVVRNYV